MTETQAITIVAAMFGLPASTRVMTVNNCIICLHSRRHYGGLLCVAESQSRPVEYMRHEKSSCGPDANLFEPADGRCSDLPSAES